MKETEAVLTDTPPLAPTIRPAKSQPVGLKALAAVALVISAYALPLLRLAEFALASDLYSYVVLIPVVSAYFAWQLRSTLPACARSDLILGVPLIAVGLLVLAASLMFAPAEAAGVDRLALITISFLFSTAGAIACLAGRAVLNAWLFPLGLLVFMVPLPTGVLAAIETGMQHGSAAVAKALFGLCGTPVFYQDLTFQLPGIVLRVAPECSGIRSTLVLTIVSIVTGYLFLRKPATRTVLALAIVPLALLRNGLRIFTVSELCVHAGPHMIDSYIHRHGGPIFFAISLVPFFFLVVWLQRREGTSARLER